MPLSKQFTSDLKENFPFAQQLYRSEPDTSVFSVKDTKWGRNQKISNLCLKLQFMRENKFHNITIAPISSE